MRKQTVEPRLLTLQQAAARLGVPERKLLSMIRAGVLPAVRIGTRNPWRVDSRRLDQHGEDLKALAADWVEPVSSPKVTVQRLREEQDAKRVRTLPPNADFMTVAEAADALRCSWPTVINQIHDGTFQATKVNRRWQIAKVDVDAVVMEKKVARLKAKRARRAARARRDGRGAYCRRRISDSGTD